MLQSFGAGQSGQLRPWTLINAYNRGLVFTGGWANNRGHSSTDSSGVRRVFLADCCPHVVDAVEDMVAGHIRSDHGGVIFVDDSSVLDAGVCCP